MLNLSLVGIISGAAVVIFLIFFVPFWFLLSLKRTEIDRTFERNQKFVAGNNIQEQLLMDGSKKAIRGYFNLDTDNLDAFWANIEVLQIISPRVVPALLNAEVSALYDHSWMRKIHNKLDGNITFSKKNAHEFLEHFSRRTLDKSQVQTIIDSMLTMKEKIEKIMPTVVDSLHAYQTSEMSASAKQDFIQEFRYLPLFLFLHSEQELHDRYTQIMYQLLVQFQLSAKPTTSAISITDIPEEILKDKTFDWFNKIDWKNFYGGRFADMLIQNFSKIQTKGKIFQKIYENLPKNL